MKGKNILNKVIKKKDIDSQVRTNPSWMKITKTFLTGIIFLFLGIFLLSFFLFLYGQIKLLNASSDLVTRTNALKLKLSELVISLKDVETLQQEYLLTHDTVFLAPYQEAYSHFWKSLDEIDSLVKDDPTQQINVLAIKVFSKEGIMSLDRYVHTDQFPQTDGPGMTLYFQEGKIKMDRIRAQINLMSQVEDSLLKKRVEEGRTNTFLTPRYALIFFIVTLLILIVAFLKINKNVHTQRKLKVEILASKLFLESMLDASDEIVFAFDKNLRFTALNKSAEKNYNITREVMGKQLYEVLPEFREADKDLFREVLTGKPVLNYVIRSKIADHFIEVNVVPLRSIAGEVSGALLTGRDITALMVVTQTLKQKNEELERSNQELSSFSYVASHDLQEPLRKIQSFSNRIVEKEGSQFSEITKDYFKRIVSAAKRMQDLIEALLHFSRTNTSELIFEAANLNGIVEDVKTNLRENIEEKNAVIESLNLPVLKVVPLQFSQLILNLVSNSLKYSKADTPPHIKISADIVDQSVIQTDITPLYKTYWKISIEDNGIGFEQQYEHKIFELFQRLHGKLEYGGTGIGLAICKKIVQNHNGIITATGKPGIGSVFNIYLPVK